MKIGICGYYGVNNLGDEAILEALKYALGNKYPGAEFVVFGKGMQFPIGIRSFIKSIFLPKLWKKPVSAIKTCDLFILGGGGLFTDEEGMFVPVYWALQGLLARIFCKKVICLGISIGRLNTLNKVITKLFLKRLKLITVRDEKSYLKLLKWGIKSYNLSDLTFLLPYNYTKIYNKQKYVVLSLRKFKKLTPISYKIIAQACDELIEKYGFNIKLLPFQAGTEYDTGILNKIYELSKNKNKICVLDVSTQSIPSIINLLGHAEVIIGMRLHACILASIAGTALIPLSYMQKVDDFWKNEHTFTPININKISVNRLMERFDCLTSHLSETRVKVMEFANANRSKAQKLFSLLDNT